MTLKVLIYAWRLRTNNAIIAFENFHSLQTIKRKNSPFISLTLKMSKAIDRVEWVSKGYLWKTCTPRSFSLIMKFISLSLSPFLLNGILICIFKSSRGIRQGDPLSPYLFILCVEGFSTILWEAQESGALWGFHIGNDPSIFSHLLFYDDSLLFSWAYLAQATKLRDIFYLYEACSGQTINFEKSNFFFSKGAPSTLKEEIC